MKQWATLLLCLCLSGQAMAQGGGKAFVKKVGTMIDSMSVKGVDRRYIDAPKRPWQIIARENMNYVTLGLSFLVNF